MLCPCKWSRFFSGRSRRKNRGIAVGFLKNRGEEAGAAEGGGPSLYFGWLSGSNSLGRTKPPGQRRRSKRENGLLLFPSSTSPTFPKKLKPSCRDLRRPGRLESQTAKSEGYAARDLPSLRSRSKYISAVWSVTLAVAEARLPPRIRS